MSSPLPPKSVRMSGNYTSVIDVGNVTSFTLTAGLVDGQTYYFAIKAYDTSGNKSSFLNEVKATIPDIVAELPPTPEPPPAEEPPPSNDGSNDGSTGSDSGGSDTGNTSGDTGSNTGNDDTASGPDPNTGEPIVVEVPIARSADDVEERVGQGKIDLGSSDVDLGEEVVGLRFALAVPPGATILTAYVQFTTDDVTGQATELTVEGEASAHAAPFTQTKWNVTDRLRTAAAVSWTPQTWAVKKQAGEAERTPELAPTLQEIVEQPQWQSGNALVLIFTGAGHRAAFTYDAKPSFAPVLHVEYTLEAESNHPSVVLPVAAVTASAAQAPDVPANTLDGNLGARWSANGQGQWISYDLGSAKTVSHVAIAWHLGDSRTAVFDIEVSLDGQNWTTVHNGTSSGLTVELEGYDFDDVTARFVRLVGFGTSANTWNSITELVIFGW